MGVRGARAGVVSVFFLSSSLLSRLCPPHFFLGFLLRLPSSSFSFRLSFVNFSLFPFSLALLPRTGRPLLSPCHSSSFSLIHHSRFISFFFHPNSHSLRSPSLSPSSPSYLSLSSSLICHLKAPFHFPPLPMPPPTPPL